MSKGPVIVELTISTNFALAKWTGTFEIERDEWDEMDPDERADYIDEAYQTELSNCLDGGWRVVGDDDIDD